MLFLQAKYENQSSLTRVLFFAYCRSVAALAGRASINIPACGSPPLGLADTVFKSSVHTGMPLFNAQNRRRSAEPSQLLQRGEGEGGAHVRAHLRPMLSGPAPVVTDWSSTGQPSGLENVTSLSIAGEEKGPVIAHVMASAPIITRAWGGYNLARTDIGVSAAVTETTLGSSVMASALRVAGGGSKPELLQSGCFTAAVQQRQRQPLMSKGAEGKKKGACCSTARGQPVCEGVEGSSTGGRPVCEGVEGKKKGACSNTGGQPVCEGLDEAYVGLYTSFPSEEVGEDGRRSASVGNLLLDLPLAGRTSAPNSNRRCRGGPHSSVSVTSAAPRRSISFGASRQHSSASLGGDPSVRGWNNPRVLPADVVVFATGYMKRYRCDWGAIEVR